MTNLDLLQYALFGVMNYMRAATTTSGSERFDSKTLNRHYILLEGEIQKLKANEDSVVEILDERSETDGE